MMVCWCRWGPVGVIAVSVASSLVDSFAVRSCDLGSDLILVLDRTR